MLLLKTKVGQKGQIVIPKVFREEYGMDTKTEVVMEDTGDGILIQKPLRNIADQMRKMALRHHKKINPSQLKKLYESQYEERLKRAGV